MRMNGFLEVSLTPYWNDRGLGVDVLHWPCLAANISPDSLPDYHLKFYRPLKDFS